jgi:hypothetical protein
MQRPVLKLGVHGSWTLGDITESRAKKLDALIGRFAEIDADAGLIVAAEAVGELAEAACINGDGLKDLIVGLCDESVHGEDVLGVKALSGLVEFIAEWFAGESAAGEG